MSFASTPLGQGRRLDHHTFLNKNGVNPRRVPKVPSSYAYGASSQTARSPPKPDRAPVAAHPPAEDADEPALVRYARIKAQSTRTSDVANTHPAPAVVSTTARDTVTTPRPDRWSVKDTSVNIASAIHTAATAGDEPAMPAQLNPNDAWASRAPHAPPLPRSTSVDYEKETQTVANRRLAPPARSRPPPLVKAASIRHVPDSEDERDPPPRAPVPRGQSPLELFESVARRFVPLTFTMRERTDEPQPPPTNGDVRDPSYDYSTEERDYQEATAQKTSAGRAAHRRNRISVDNKAYRPSVSDLDQSDEDVSDDDKRTRRRRARKSGAAGGPLTTLPVAGYEKRKRRRKNGVQGEGEEEEGGEEESASFGDQDRSGEQGTTQSLRASQPPLSRGSIPPPSRRGSVPPLYNSSQLDTDPEMGLDSIPEIEEPPLVDGVDGPEERPRGSFSIGAVLGRCVHWVLTGTWIILQEIMGLFASLMLGLGRLFGIALDALVFTPVRWLTSLNLVPFFRYFVAGLVIYAAWRALDAGWIALPSRHSPTAVYQPPDVPAANIAELSERLQSLETALAALSLDAARSRNILEGNARNSAAEVSGRLGALETRLQEETRKQKERVRALDTETRASVNEGLQIVKLEVQALQAQLQAQRERERNTVSGPVSDEEARARLQALEERVGTVEGGVTEALELGKIAAKAEAPLAPSSTTLAWWNKLASGAVPGVALTADGQDVTALIAHMIDAAVSLTTKDTLARVDYAFYPGGARVIPTLTSETLEIRPATLGARIAGFFMGDNVQMGHPPAMALHHDINNGQCWPFMGQQGQLAVMLAAPVYISDITIDHVAREVATDLRSAPREMELWGLIEGSDNVAKADAWRARWNAEREAARDEGREVRDEGENLIPPPPPTLPKNVPYMRIARFTYDIHSSAHIQTFAVSDEVRALEIDFGVVVLMVKNNWGRDLTCLYRLRVHGEPLNAITLPTFEELGA